MSRSLEELIDEHLQALVDKLTRPGTLEELKGELDKVSDLLQSYRFRDELVKRLLDGTTPADKRKQIIETLRVQRMKVTENQAELERLHAKSQQLFERSNLLIRQAQEQINKLAHLHAGYWLEVCGVCRDSSDTKGLCPVCKGAGRVLVPAKVG